MKKQTGKPAPVRLRPNPAEGPSEIVLEASPEYHVSEVLAFSTWTGSKSASPANEAITFALKEQVHSAFQTALKFGLSGRRLLEIVSAEARPFLEEELRAGYATREEGLVPLLNAEGGCADVAEARMLFSRPKGVSRQTISEKIRSGEFIGYRTGGDQWFLPRWQFRPQGGLLNGLPEVLEKLRRVVPQGGELFPFTFFLQADPVTGGRTPLEALRAGEVESVLRAVDGYMR